MTDTADTLIHAQWVIPCDTPGRVLKAHSLAITGNRISGIYSRQQASAIAAGEVIELPGHALLPGLVNCHGHAAMTLLRGYADDLPLLPWLEENIWPAESAWVSEEFVADGAELAVVEMLRAGITTFSDMYFFPDATARAAAALGMRCQLAAPVLDTPTAWARDANEYIGKALALRDEMKHNDLIQVVFGPHAVYTVSEESLKRLATLAAELDLAVHIHLHETAAEVLQAVERNGERPLRTLYRLGLLGPRTQCVHMTDISDDDLALLRTSGAHVIHCPQSNMKLASGTCPVNRLAENGINVALGTDSAASNNDLNLFGEMQSAALLAKLQTRRASALPAPEVLSMATLNGARALGMDAETGSLETGKLADLIAIDLSGPETRPVYDPVSQIVYACNGSQVNHSWINGRRVLDARRPTRCDLPELLSRIENWGARISTGVEV